MSLSRGHITNAAVLIIVLGLHSCARIYSVVDFEVMEPATVSFPDNVGQLLVMNRSPFSLAVLDEEDWQGLTKDHLVILDTTISKSTFRGMQNVLQQSPVERFHKPFWISDRVGDTTSLEDLYLTKREVSTLCDYYGADAIICMELYSLDVDDHYIYYSDAPEAIQVHYHELSNKIQWNIYLPGSPRPFDTYTFVDTIYFTDVQEGQVQPVPDILKMIKELFYESGKKYGRYLVPVWNQTSRLLYVGKGDSLKLASRHTSKGEWDQAYEIWEELTNSIDNPILSDSTMVSKAFNNMAIYYELEDNLDSASLMINMALKYDSLEAIKFYKEELDIRILNRNEIIKQIRR